MVYIHIHTIEFTFIVGIAIKHSFLTHTKVAVTSCHMTDERSYI